jgi:hypothetical protein
MTLRNASNPHVCASEIAAGRERVSTNRHTTARRMRHAWIVGLAAALAACGGQRRSDSYQKATTQQESCCEHLHGDARRDCLSTIVRVDDPAVAGTDANQDTFRCVERNFVCDPATGHATQESAQEQYDCIAGLGH